MELEERWGTVQILWIKASEPYLVVTLQSFKTIHVSRHDEIHVHTRAILIPAICVTWLPAEATCTGCEAAATTLRHLSTCLVSLTCLAEARNIRDLAIKVRSWSPNQPPGIHTCLIMDRPTICGPFRPNWLPSHFQMDPIPSAATMTIWRQSDRQE